MSLAGNGEKWRWADAAGVQRVVPFEDLRTALANGALAPTTLVWRPGMTGWQPAAQVAELMSPPAPESKATAVGVPPPPASVVAVQAEFERGGFPSVHPKPREPSKSTAPPPPPVAARTAAAPAAPSGSVAARDAAPAARGAEPKAAPPVPPAARSAERPVDVSPGVEKAPPAPRSAARQSGPPRVPPVARVAPGGPAGQPKSALPHAPAASPAVPAARVAAPAVAPPATKRASAPPPPPKKTSSENAPTLIKNAAGAGVDVPQNAPADPNGDLETWVAKPAMLGALTPSAPVSQPVAGEGSFPAVRSPTAQPPIPAKSIPAAGLAISEANASRGEDAAWPVQHTPLPPTRASGPLPPPPRRSHPAPLTHSPPFAGSADSPPMPPVPGPVSARAGQTGLESSANGATDEEELPSFPLDEIDPDEDVAFNRSSHAEPAASHAGHGGLASGAAGLASRAALGRVGEALRVGLAHVRANPNDPKVLAGLGAGALAVIGVLVAIAAGSGESRTSSATESAAAESPASDSTVQKVTAAAASAPAPAGAPATVCRLTGEPTRLADKASKDVPLELAVTPDGERVRLGFATTTNTAQGLSIELASLSVTPEFARPSKDKLRAVAPIVQKDGSTFLVHADGKADRLKAWRTLSVDPPLVVGFTGDALSIAPRATEAPTTLWSLEGEDAPDAIRTADLGERGRAIVFRRRGEILAGLVGNDRAAVGGLVKVAGAGAPPGSPVGSPALAVNGQSLAVAFADRVSSAEPWGIRIGSAPLGSLPQQTSAFAVPSGGPGGAVLAPALSGLPDGRWLLVWTEGSGGDHDVRAVMLDERLSPVGAPFAVSRAGSNAGQGAVALHEGRGLVAYLALTDDNYEVWGAAVDCR